MLETIRKFSNSPIVKAVLIILAFTFLFCFGITDIIRRFMGKDYVVKVGNVKILPAQFKMEKEKKRHMMKREHVDDKDLAIELLHQLIRETVVNIASDQYGLVVSDETMKRYIGGMSFFRDANGHFNANLLRGFLSKLEIPEQMFIESSRREIKSSIIKAPFGGISITGELQTYAAARNEKRSVAFVELSPKSFKVVEEPSQEDLQQFFATHSDMFMIDETRTFSLAELKEADLEKKIVITDDELRDAYETSSGRDERSFEDMKKELEIDLRNEKLESITNEFCRNIEDDLTAGEDILSVAKKYNLKLTKAENVSIKDTGVLKELPYASNVLNTAFTLDEGPGDSFSESLGKDKERVLWIVCVHSITPKHSANFEKIIPDVKKAWRAERQHQMAIDLANKWKEIGNKGKLQDLALEASKKVEFTALFDRDGKCVENSKHSGVIDLVCDDVFNLNRRDVNYVEHDGKVTVYQVDKIHSPKIEGDQLIASGRELTGRVRDDMYQELVGYLSKEYEVSINNEVLQQLNENVPANIELF